MTKIIRLDMDDERSEQFADLTSKDFVRYCQKRARRSKDHLYRMADLMQQTFNVDREIAVAIVCKEVNCRVADDKSSVEFHWPD